LTGDDEDDEQPSPPPSADGSVIGRDDEGGSNVPGTDADIDVAKKDATLGTDGSPDAKTDATMPPPSRYVFVTSTDYPGTFGAGGEVAAGADADVICKTHGDASSLAKLQGRTWKAWVSTATPAENAASRIAGATVSAFRLPDDILVATSYGDLIDGTLLHAINKDENGNELGALPVWTGSTAAGALAGNHCSNWSSSMIAATGRVGSTASNSAAWSDYADLECPQMARLYCFQQ
jgi:hypothetical protein